MTNQEADLIIKRLQNREKFILNGKVINDEIGSYNVHLRKNDKIAALYNLFYGNWKVENTYIFLSQRFFTRISIYGELVQTSVIKYLEIEFC